MRVQLVRGLAMVGGVAAVLISAGFAADGPSAKRQQDQATLKTYGLLVGEWKGTGQLQRGVAKGSWVENGEWAWKLTNDSAALELTVAKGKWIKSIILKPGKTDGAFLIDATLADDSKRSFTGKVGARDALVCVSDTPKGEGVRKITLTPLHETRFLMLLESQGDSGSSYRLAEVGYTRQGVAFAAAESGPVCIVTGGRGTTQVSYQGKTYYVCCSGCKDLFNEDPKGVLAEYDAKKKAKESGK